MSHSNSNQSKVTKSHDQQYEIQEDPTNFLASAVFSIPLIFHEILVNLDVPDLLNTSIVSKSWLQESRKVLRTKKICVIKMGKQETCCKLKELNEQIDTFDHIPFNGIQLSPFCYACVKRNLSPENTPQPESFLNIYSRIKMEHVIIMNPNNSCRLHSSREFLRVMRVLLPSSPHCLAEQFLRRIFLEYSSQLKTLSISYPLNSPDGSYGIYPNIVSEILCDTFQENFYPNLVTLNLIQGPFPHYVSDEVITHLLRRSPRLRDIYGYISPSLLDAVLQKNSAHLVKEFVLSPDPSFAQQYLTLAEASPKIRVMIAARKWLWQSEGMEFMKNVFNTLMTANKDSLERLNLDQSVLTLLVSLNLSFPSVTHLRVHYDQTNPDFEVYQPFDSIDLVAIFPQLEYLDLHLNFKSYQAVEDCFRLESPKPCKSVKNLAITFLQSPAKVNGLQERCLQSVLAMLPNVGHFEVNFPERLDQILDFLWSASWTRLEDFYCQVHVSQCVENLDQSFLGRRICEELRSGSNFIGLKRFRVTFFHSKQVCQALTSPETVFLSEEAVEEVTDKFPELVLEIQQYWDNYTRNDLPCNLSMEHLKRFKNVKISTLPTAPASNSFSFNEYECGPPKVYGLE